ncbi:clip-associated protein [Phtheirospermum japonicum]|uniref:Clip-associated protein n=1 Tax=Phtheirospermum japonicum TaxID=374723 RepID=A0A830CP94_9LAMI|nr:clip-associated protein [Phtheirospermum japonicum]
MAWFWLEVKSVKWNPKNPQIVTPCDCGEPLNPPRWLIREILTAVLEVLDDSDSSIRVLALAMIAEMVKNQKVYMEDSVEIVIEKLIHAIKDSVPKVSDFKLGHRSDKHDSVSRAPLVAPARAPFDSHSGHPCASSSSNISSSNAHLIQVDPIGGRRQSV